MINVALPHDLIRLSDVDDLALGDAPDWVRSALSTTPWVVRRRSLAAPGFVAVGVRGATRSHRHAMVIHCDQIGRQVRPEDLVDRPTPRDMPVFRSLRQLRSTVDASSLKWGPAGSSGFELATGATTVTEDSDLDLIVRIDSLSAKSTRQLRLLNDQFTTADVRVDCQIQFPFGAVALREFSGCSPQVLVRSETGVRLTSRTELAL